MRNRRCSTRSNEWPRNQQNRKISTPKSSKPHRPADTRKDYDAAIKLLEEYHQTGRDSLARHEDYVPGDEASELLRKARVFARRYTAEDLKRLKVLIKEHHMALGCTFIDRLATIKKDERPALEERVIRERWSLLELNREIRGTYGRRRRAGKKSHVPKTETEAISDLVHLCVKLTRWGQGVDLIDTEGQVAKRITHEVIKQLPRNVREKLKVALIAVCEFQKAAEARLPPN